MWFDKERMLDLLRKEGVSIAEFAYNLGLPIREAKRVIRGERATNYRQSSWLLAYFGIWDICVAMRDEKYMKFAVEATAEGRA